MPDSRRPVCATSLQNANVALLVRCELMGHSGRGPGNGFARDADPTQHGIGKLASTSQLDVRLQNTKAAISPAVSTTPTHDHQRRL